MDTLTAAYTPRWFHQVDNIQICLAARFAYPEVSPGGGELPGGVITTGKEWEKWFKDTSKALHDHLQEWNKNVRLLNEAFDDFVETHPLTADVLPGTYEDAILWAEFAGSDRNSGPNGYLKKITDEVPIIRNMVGMANRPWPPLGCRGIPGTTDACNMAAQWLSNNGDDLVSLPENFGQGLIHPLTFQAQKSGVLLGTAAISFTQDCEWLESPTKKPSDWRSFGIITNFSLRLVSTEWFTLVYQPFSKADFIALPALANKLKQPTRSVDIWLNALLPEDTKTELSNYEEGSDPTNLLTFLLRDFDRIMLGPSIYEQSRFNGVALRQKTDDLRQQNPHGDELTRLNRLLLEDAYPAELEKMQGGLDPSSSSSSYYSTPRGGP